MSQQTKRKRNERDQAWRDRPSIKHPPTSEELDKIVSSLAKYIRGQELAIQLDYEEEDEELLEEALKRYLVGNQIQYSNGNGRYSYWLGHDSYNSTAKLAKHFVPSLGSTKAARQAQARQGPGTTGIRAATGTGIRPRPRLAAAPSSLSHEMDSSGDSDDETRVAAGRGGAGMEFGGGDEGGPGPSTEASRIASKFAEMQAQMTLLREENERTKAKQRDMRLRLQNKIRLLSNKRKSRTKSNRRRVTVSSSSSSSSSSEDDMDVDVRAPSRRRRGSGRRRVQGSPPRFPDDDDDDEMAQAQEEVEEQEQDEGHEDGVFDYVEDPAPFDAIMKQLTTRIVAEYRLPPVLELTLGDVQRLFDRKVTWMGQDTTLGELCNFGPEDVLEAFRHRGVAFAMAMEQSQKSFLLVALAALASMVKRPCVVLVGLAHPCTKDLEGKMAGTLAGFGISTRFLSNAQGGWNKFLADDHALSEFHSGHCVVITPGYAMARSTFINELEAQNVLMLLDEGDALMGRDSWNAGMKEYELASVIGKPHAQDSRVTGVVSVSATHLADFHLWSKAMPEVPRCFISVSLEVLKQRGFTTHEDMDLVHTVSMKDAKADTMYGLETPGFRYLMDDFKTCPGTKKLLLVASSPYVNAGNATLFKQADEVLRQDPDALVVVHNSGKCYLKHKDNLELETGVEITKRNPAAHSEDDKMKRKKVKSVSEALKILQLHYCCTQSSDQPYRDRRFVVVGYNALARSTSVRTGDMVPTHMFALMGKGKDSAVTRQTLMRPAGKTTLVRHTNGHRNVKVVTTEEDWETVTSMYGFSEYVGKEANNNPDFDFESHHDYPIGATAVVESTRKHFPRSYKTTKVMKVNATEEEKEAYERELALKRRERLERRLQNENDLAVASAAEEDVVEEEEQEQEEDDDGIVGDGRVEEDALHPVTVAGEDLPLERRDTNKRRDNVMSIIVKDILTVLHSSDSPMSFDSLMSALPREVATAVQVRNRRPLTVMRQRGLVAYDELETKWSITVFGREAMKV